MAMASHIHSTGKGQAGNKCYLRAGAATCIEFKPLLPSVLSPADINQLLQKSLHSKPDALLCCDTIVVSQQLIDVCSRRFDKIMSSKAEKDAQKNPIMLSFEGEKQAPIRVSGISETKDDRKEQRRKKAAGSSKSGGGLQGREVKMKSTKKKYRGRDTEGENQDERGDGGGGGKQRLQELPFLSVDEIAEELTGGECLQNCPEELIQEIAERLHRPLTQQYQEIAKSIFLQSVGAASSGARKKTHGELSDKITGLWRNALLFEKGLLLFPDDTQTLMYKHLLRTICSDIANLIFCEVASDHLIAVSAEDSQLTPEGRLKLLSKIHDKTRIILTKMHASLNGKNLEDFLQQLELMCATDQLEVLLKKPDKKKERQLVLSHREMLREQLRQEDSPAMVLHLVAVLLVQFHKQCLLHAPGRCVPQILTLLRGHLVPEDYDTLLRYQDLVVKQMKLQQNDNDSAENNNDLCEQLKELLPKVKDIALNPKKVQNSDSGPAAE
ncbi:E3 UFM1-protein ligase 1 [Lamellibrachia satsuma]|nr:E3 UFM1-protein ligase 1 [Lamellibrachia satsuma]